MSRARGRPPHPDLLTPAEWQVLNLLRHGASTARIARLRKTSPDAVKFHVANMLSKLQLASRADLRHWDGVPADSAIRPERGTPAMTELHLGPIGQIAREVTNIREAEQWYRDVIGLPHLFTFGDLVFFDCGGTRLFLTPPENGAVKPQSVLYFRVKGIHDAHRTLAERGVKFLGAPHLIHRHADGTEEWMAFFEDPDGHTLALMEQVAGPPQQGKSRGGESR